MPQRNEWQTGEWASTWGGACSKRVERRGVISLCGDFSGNDEQQGHHARHDAATLGFRLLAYGTP